MPLPDDVIEDLAERVRLSVAGGYDTSGQLIEGLVELIEYDPDTADAFKADRDGTVALITGMVEAALEEHETLERDFPETTDCDRLTALFEQLDAGGILTGEDIGYTQSDLRDDMWQRVDDARASGRAVRGWAAFHRQDVDRAVDTGVLCVAYASVTDDDDGFREIGHELAGAFTDAGFTVDWDGNPNKRIELTGLRWQRRRGRRKRRPNQL